MAQAALDKHYGMLSATERFALMIEAMARRDERECDRLEETCPRFMYRCEDQAFRDRMRRASAIAHRVSLNMREGLAQIRLARLFHEHAEMFAGDSIRVMQAVFLYGREYGKWEVGAIEEVGLPDAEELVDDVAAHPDLGDQLEELREIAKESVVKVASGLREMRWGRCMAWTCCRNGKGSAVSAVKPWAWNRSPSCRRLGWSGGTLRQTSFKSFHKLPRTPNQPPNGSDDGYGRGSDALRSRPKLIWVSIPSGSILCPSKTRVFGLAGRDFPPVPHWH